MSSHDDLIEKAEDAINELFSDQSVSKEDTITDMKDLISDLEIKIESLKER